MFQPKNILVPTDFSEDSYQALKVALDIAGKYRSRVFLLHVIDGSVRQCVADYCLDWSVVERIGNESVIFSNEKLKETIEKIQIPEGIKIIPDVRNGFPYEEILREAAQRKVDLIVIASHGKTGLKKYFMGSVAEKVTKEARCPVLLIRN
ncbi:MAG: universal stress protein [Syntrophales bacterium]